MPSHSKVYIFDLEKLYFKGLPAVIFWEASFFYSFGRVVIFLYFCLRLLGMCYDKTTF